MAAGLTGVIAVTARLRGALGRSMGVLLLAGYVVDVAAVWH